MPIDLEQVRGRLKTLQSQTKKQDSFWKPTGTSVIRIVPYKFNKDNPFIELLFHYNLGNKSYLSPQTFGRPDPIVEFAEKLKQSGDKDNYKQGKQLEPKLRTFVPMVVRGKENEGVKFWGFGKTVYQEILGLISDPEYGDITDIASGHDITVEFKSAEQTGKNFPSTTIRPRPSKTKLVESSEQLKALFDTQKNILDIYKEPSYEDLEKVLADWLNGGSDDDTSDGSGEETVTNYAQAKEKSKSSDAAPVAKETSVDNIEADLDKLFEK
jgi:hypothetical protein